MSPQTYKPATKLRPGISVCSAGYEDCPEGSDNHYHCGNCGGVTGMFGHLVQKDGDWVMDCPTSNQESSQP